MSYPALCATLACPRTQSPGLCGLCLCCWLKLPLAERKKRLAAQKLTETTLARKAVGNG